MNPDGEHDWDARAAWYDRVVDLFEPEARRATEALLDAVGAGPGTRLLDVACGAGHTTAAAAARGAEALGIDKSPAMLEAAKRRFPDVRFRLADMLDPPRGPWDGVVCRFGAHHADPAWIQAAWRVLRPGGRLAIAEPDATGPRDGGKGPPGHWADLMAAAGFTGIDVRRLDMHLGALAAGAPPGCLGGHDAHQAHVHDGPVHIIGATKPDAGR